MENLGYMIKNIFVENIFVGAVPHTKGEPTKSLGRKISFVSVVFLQIQYRYVGLCSCYCSFVTDLDGYTSIVPQSFNMKVLRQLFNGSFFPPLLFEFIVCNIQLVLSRKLVSVFATIYLFAIIYRDDFGCSAKFFTSVRKELPSLVIRTHHSLV